MTNMVILDINIKINLIAYYKRNKKLYKICTQKSITKYQSINDIVPHHSAIGS